MIKFKVKVSGTEEGKKKTIDKSKLVLMKCMFKMEELAIDYAPYDTGYLTERINLFPEILAGHYVLKSEAPYSADLEFGNTPREVEYEDIEAWALRKGIVSGKNTGAFVNYVVEKIRTKGVNAQPYMRPANKMIQSFWMPIYMKEVFGAES